MFIFRGELSECNKKYLIQKEKLGNFLAIIIVALISSIPIIILSCLYDWIFILCFLPFVFMLIYLAIPIGKSTLDIILPTEIIIVHDMIISKGNKFNSARKLADVKKIVDLGSCYHFYFCFPHKNLRFLCQKDLIKEGIIEDFEIQFKDKIVRK